MKNIFTLLLLMFLTTISYTQTINFNNYLSSTNNDLANNFMGSYLYTQQIAGGITGGCVQIPFELFPEPAVYKPIYHWNFTPGNPLNASICFKYVSDSNVKTQAYPACKLEFIQYDSAFMIFAPNKLVYAVADYLDLDAGAGIAISSTSYLPLFFELPTSWYRLDMNSYSVDSLITCNVSLYNLGANGQATPSLVKSTTVSRKDYFHLDPTANFYFRIQAFEHYGGILMDNFNYPLQPSSVSSMEKEFPFSIIQSHNVINVINNERKNYQLGVYNSVGQLVYSDKGNDLNKFINLQNLEVGLYFVQLVSSDNKKTFKVFVK